MNDVRLSFAVSLAEWLEGEVKNLTDARFEVEFEVGSNFIHPSICLNDKFVRELVIKRVKEAIVGTLKELDSLARK